MFTKRTDLAIEAHELWQESAGKTTRLAGVKATEKKIQGYPVTQVDILDREGEAALGKPAGSYRTLDLTAFWQRGDGFFDRAVRAVGQQVKELTPDSGPVLVVGLGNRAMTPDAVGPLAADSILIPIQCEYYALEGVASLMNTISRVKKTINPHLEIEGVLLTMLDGRTNLGLQVVDEVKKHFKKQVYATVIPRSVRLGEAPSHGEPIHVYDKRSAGCVAYVNLAKEVLKRNNIKVKEFKL